MEVSILKMILSMKNEFTLNLRNTIPLELQLHDQNVSKFSK